MHVPHNREHGLQYAVVNVDDHINTVVERDKVRGELSRTLTAREIVIVQMVARGLRNRAIGEQLSITESTVKVHVRNIMKKLNAKNRTQVAYMTNQLDVGLAKRSSHACGRCTRGPSSPPRMGRQHAIRAGAHSIDPSSIRLRHFR